MFRLDARSMKTTYARLVAKVLLYSLALASGSATATQLYGGGSTLPAGAYVGFDFLVPGGTQRMSNNTNAGQNGAAISLSSIFGAWSAASGNQLGYCQAGSGNAKKIFDHYDGTNVLPGAVGTCNGTVYGWSGFGAPTGVAVDPHFASSDAPMSVNELAWFDKGGKASIYGQPVQLPAIATSIAIVYNNPDIPDQLKLSRSQVCDVFNGTITNWNMLDPTLPPKPLKLAYVTEDSGTTFSLANYLAAACPGSAASHFIVDQAFSNVISRFRVGIGAVPSVNDANLINQVNENDGSIGYAGSPILKDAQARGLAYNVNYARIEGFDPFVHFPPFMNIPAVFDSALVQAHPTTGQAVSSQISPPASGCIVFIDPNSYALHPGRYPIMAISYLIANYRGNGADTYAVRGFLSSVYNRSAGTVLPRGYAFVNPGSIFTNKISSCINF